MSQSNGTQQDDDKMAVIRAGNKTIVEVETVVYRKDGTIKDYEIDRIEIPEGGNEK